MRLHLLSNSSSKTCHEDKKSNLRVLIGYKTHARILDGHVRSHALSVDSLSFVKSIFDLDVDPPRDYNLN